MFKKIILPIAAVAVLILSSCSSKLGPLGPENFNVQPNPLETMGGQVPVTINGAFPEKYMKRKAIVTVIPELRAADGSTVQGAPATFQGEKVLGNDQVISYILGGHYTMKAEMPYSEAFHKSDLYMTFRAFVGKKEVKIPAVKVANGVIATAELYRKALAQSGGVIAPDTFQRVKVERQEANIKFLINQAQLRQSELKSNSVQEFVSMLKRINDDREAYQLSSVEVRAYASPDGAEKFNDQLAQKRQNSSEQYVREQMKNANLTGDVDAMYTAEDWEGFQQLVAASSIQDKDIILRVLSLYDDPQEREQQVKNISAGYQELTTAILPELRRARLIINYEAVGRSDVEIRNQYAADASKLSADEILYSATIEGTTNNEKEAIYKTCAKLYPNDYRALNNLASMAIAKGDINAAKSYLADAVKVNPKAGEPQANLAIIALLDGNIDQADAYMAKATTSAGYQKALGTLNIAKGNYAQAANNLRGTVSNMTVLAQILNKDYDGAQKTFKYIGSEGDALTDYLHAINNARLGNKYASNAYLKDALQKDPSLQRYADEDLEFAVFK